MKTFIMIVLAALLCSTAFAQSDLVKGSDSVTETIIGVYPSQDASGNQDWVREYDGREFNNGIGIEKIESYGYKGPFQYSFSASDLILTDEDVVFDGRYGNLVGINLSTSALTHRLAPYYGANVWLVGTPGAGLDTITPLGDPNAQFYVDRRVNEFSIRATPGEARAMRFVLGNWEQTKTGTMQALARARIPTTASSAKRSAAIENDNSTSQTTMGFDSMLGSVSAFNYRNIETKYGQYAGRGTPGSVNDFSPFNVLTKVNSTTSSNVLKLRTKLGERTYLTGAQTYKSRTDSSAIAVSTRTSIAATNLGLTSLLGDDVTLSAGFRLYNMGDKTYTMGTDRRSYTLDATYTGFKKTYLKAGYERQNANYNADAPIPPWASFTSKWNILRAGFRMCPVEKLNIQANYENWDGNVATYNGSQNNKSKLDVNGTYLVKDNFAIYGNYNQSEESNSQIRVDPVPLSNLGLREEASGQYYDGELTSTVVGAWYSITPRLTFDLNWSTIGTDAKALWVLYYSGANQQEFIAPFNTDNDQWNLGATYQLTPVWRVRGSYLSSDSSGKSVLTPKAGTPLAGFGPDWTPISVDQQAYSLGVSHDVSSKDSLDLDFTTSFFHNRVDPSQNGTFGLLRVGWTRTY